MRIWKVAAACACAVVVASAAQAGDALVGTWKLDAAHSKNTDITTPKTEVISAKPGGYTFREITEMHPGATQMSDMNVILDGKPHTLDIQGSKLTQTFTRTDPNTIKIVSVGDGHPLGTSTIALSADGKTLSITDASPPGSGSPVLVRVYHK